MTNHVVVTVVADWVKAACAVLIDHVEVVCAHEGLHKAQQLPDLRRRDPRDGRPHGGLRADAKRVANDNDVLVWVRHQRLGERSTHSLATDVVGESGGGGRINSNNTDSDGNSDEK